MTKIAIMPFTNGSKLMSFRGGNPPHPQFFFRNSRLPKINPAYVPEGTCIIIVYLELSLWQMTSSNALFAEMWYRSQLNHLKMRHYFHLQLPMVHQCLTPSNKTAPTGPGRLCPVIMILPGKVAALSEAVEGAEIVRLCPETAMIPWKVASFSEAVEGAVMVRLCPTLTKRRLARASALVDCIMMWERELLMHQKIWMISHLVVIL